MKILTIFYLDDGSKKLSSVFSCDMTCIPRVGDQVQFDGAQHFVREVFWLLPSAAGEEVRIVVGPPLKRKRR